MSSDAHIILHVVSLYPGTFTLLFNICSTIINYIYIYIYILFNIIHIILESRIGSSLLAPSRIPLASLGNMFNGRVDAGDGILISAAH